MRPHDWPIRTQPRHSRGRRWRGAWVAMLIAMVFSGCEQTPQVPFDNLRYSAALLTLASSRNEGQIDRVVAVIDNAALSGGLSQQERSISGAIIAKMRTGQWDEAEAACRHFRKAQLYR
jgi:hypothetical protein